MKLRTDEKGQSRNLFIIFAIVFLITTLILSLGGCYKQSKGETGAKGDTGVVGSPGVSCSVLPVLSNLDFPNGGAVITCGDNTVSIKNGTNGINATPVTVMKLCLGTNTYPSTFVEDAFCINNKLYAVYSANGGFLTELTPGSYSSNAIGSSCSLTVTANCVVSN